MHLKTVESCTVFCLFVLRFNVLVNNFSVMSGQSHRFLQHFRGVKCLAQGHNTAEVGFSVSCFGVRFSVMFHFMFVHYTFSSVWVAEWPPFGK